MFMFRSKRTSLTRRLFKARLIHETLRENEELLQTHIISPLRDNQLETLVTIVESGGCNGSGTCIPLATSRSATAGRRSSTRYRRSDIEDREAATAAENCNLCCYGAASSPPGSPSPPGGASRPPPLEHQTPPSQQQQQQQPPSVTPLPPLPHFLCCQIFRWTDLRNCNELKKLPQCTCDDYFSSDNEDSVLCVNPYHWSRLGGPESPPPPYRRYPQEKLRPEDRAPSLEGVKPLQPASSASSVASSSSSSSSRGGGGSLLPLGSLPTSGNGGHQAGGEWCKLAYWELQRRVGVLFSVSDSTVHVFAGPPQPGLAAASLCLDDLASSPSSSSTSFHHQQPQPPQTEIAIRRTRSKIGLGMLLSQEADGVWAYNQSENPLFVNSPTLDEPDTRTLVVYKLPPGSCLRIFDWSRASRRRRVVDPLFGPVDPHSVRISFAKGWGPKYSRQEVTACPCWIEVLLVPPPPAPCIGTSDKK